MKNLYFYLLVVLWGVSCGRVEKKKYVWADILSCNFCKKGSDLESSHKLAISAVDGISEIGYESSDNSDCDDNAIDFKCVLDGYLFDNKDRFIWTNRFLKTKGYSCSDLDLYVKKKSRLSNGAVNQYNYLTKNNEEKQLTEDNIPKTWNSVKNICCHNFCVAFLIDSYLQKQSFNIHEQAYDSYYKNVKNQKEILIEKALVINVINDIDKHTLQIGDIICVNSFEHIVIASGEKDSVYSLWYRNGGMLEKVSLKKLLLEEFENKHIEIKIIKSGIQKMYNFIINDSNGIL